jgi:thiol-disulfide isomerase/thioredoxin
MDTIWLLARLALAAVFAVAAAGKILDLEGSVKATRGFGVPERLARPIGIALPFVELLAAALLLPVSTAQLGAILASLLLLSFLTGMLNSLRQGEAPDCHCFGTFHSEPVGPSTIARNGVLLAVGVLIIAGGSSPGHSLFGWLSDESGAVQALAVLLGLVIIAVAVLGWLVVHLLGQNGRLLLRIDELAAQRAPAPATAQPTAPQQEPSKPAPAFTGSGLIGEKITLDSLRAPGLPVFLIFSDPKCGPCQALQPEIVTWQQEHKDKLTIAVVTRGSIDDVRAKVGQSGLTRVVIEEDRAISKLYDASGTPSAILIDRQGRIASKVAPGVPAIRELLATALKPAPTNGHPAASRPRVGEAAPSFSLPNAAGTETSSDSLRGSDTVILFWNPGCGFCKRMQPELSAWAAEDGAGKPKVAVVTSGTEVDARALDFASTVFLDQRFATGRTFGASGTPSGIAIDAEGKIASELAVGQAAIMSLLADRQLRSATSSMGEKSPS